VQLFAQSSTHRVDEAKCWWQAEGEAPALLPQLPLCMESSSPEGVGSLALAAESSSA
jgi:hypothetical protein